VAVTRTEALHPLPPVPDLARFSWIAFTSRNAVAAFVTALQGQGLEVPGGIRIAVVGRGTGGAVEQSLRAPDLVSAHATGAGLAHILRSRIQQEGGLEDGKKGRVLWPCAESTTPGFQHTLEAAGVIVDPWPCYATRPIDPSALRVELQAWWPWGACVFAAPSAVRAFAAAWPLPWSFAPVAIGPTTGAALNAVGVRDVVVSEGTGAGPLADAVVRALSPGTR